MKTTRTFKGPWIAVAIIVAIAIGEWVGPGISERFEIRHNPLVVALLCAGLIAALASVLHDSADLR